MGCSPSSPTFEEQQSFAEGKSPFYIKESLHALERTPGGSQKKVKKCRKKFVPRLKSINESNLLMKRNRSLSSISSISFEQSPENSFKSNLPLDQEEKKSNMLAELY